MLLSLQSVFPWLKTLHILLVMAWLASLGCALFLLVRQSSLTSASPAFDVIAGMTRQLMRAVMNPAMILAVLTGLLVALAIDRELVRTAGWLQAKLLLALGLAGVHALLIVSYKRQVLLRHRVRAGLWPLLGSVALLFSGCAVYLVVAKPW